MGHIGVYLTNHHNKTLELPVNPSRVGLPQEMATELVDITKLGNVSVIGERKIREISFEFRIPLKPKTVTYATANRLLASGWDYVNFIRNWMESKKHGRFVVTDIGFIVDVYVSKFEWTAENEDEFICQIDLKEYRNFEARKIAIKATVPKIPVQPPRPAPPKAVGIGSTVIVNGRLHRDSYGSGPGVTERNATRKVNFIAQGRSFPYHVTLLDGGWRGWVSASDVRAV